MLKNKNTSRQCRRVLIVRMMMSKQPNHQLQRPGRSTLMVPWYHQLKIIKMKNKYRPRWSNISPQYSSPFMPSWPFKTTTMRLQPFNPSSRCKRGRAWNHEIPYSVIAETFRPCPSCRPYPSFPWRPSIPFSVFLDASRSFRLRVWYVACCWCGYLHCWDEGQMNYLLVVCWPIYIYFPFSITHIRVPSVPFWASIRYLVSGVQVSHSRFAFKQINRRQEIKTKQQLTARQSWEYNIDGSKERELSIICGHWWLSGSSTVYT